MKKRNKLLMQRDEGQGVITVLYRREDSPKVIVSSYIDLTETVNADGTMKAVYTLPLEEAVSFDAGHPDTTNTNTSEYLEPDIKEVIFNKARLNGIRFSHNRNIERIEFKRCKTEEVTTLQYAFLNCLELREIKGLQNLNVCNVTSTYGAFSYCKKLTKVNIGSWDTSNCTRMGLMFYNSDSIEEINVSNLKTSNVTEMTQMFYGCKSLLALDISKWDMSSVELMGQMFYNCEKLTTLDISKWDTSNAINMVGVFENCRSLRYLDTSNLNTSKASSIMRLFKNCTSLENVDLSNFDVSQMNIMMEVFSGCESMTVIDTSTWDTSNVILATSLFANCKNAVSILVSNFVTDKMSNTSCMFYHCEKLIELNVANWNTSSFGTVSSMFEGCYSLKRLNGIGSWNMSNCTDISRILYECTEIKPVENIGGWNISSKCTNMERAFYQLHFNFLNITGWDTSKVKNMEGAFYNLVPVDANGNLAPNTGVLAISGFDFTSCPYSFQNWITGSRYGNVSIRNIKLPNTTNLKSFIRCPGAVKYNFSNWDWSNIPAGTISIAGLFGQCLNATSFNFSNWNLRNDFAFSYSASDPILVTDCPWGKVTTTGCNATTITRISQFDDDWKNA